MRPLLLLFVLLFAGCMGGLPPTYESGSVSLINIAGAPLTTVSGVHLVFISGDSIYLNPRSSGSFDLPKGDPGYYFIHAWKDGYTDCYSSIRYGGDSYPIEPVSIKLYEIPTTIPVMDSTSKTYELNLFATYEPREGETVAFMVRDPSPDSSLRLLTVGYSYSPIHHQWRGRISGAKEYIGKQVGAVVYNYACDGQTYSFLRSNGPISNLLTIQ
jgi:hypothetical protein